MEAGLPQFARPCRFIAGAASLDSLPEETLPEVAFVGRSNVGKSSLLNALVGQKALARTSQNPGATQQLNFFSLDDRLLLVDMPGYGFARVSKVQKGKWDSLIKRYLSGRVTLKRTCLLVDARRGVGPGDHEFMEMLDDAAVPFQVIATKLDTVPASDVPALLNGMQAALRTHAAAHPRILTTSSQSRAGIADLQAELLSFMLPNQMSPS